MTYPSLGQRTSQALSWVREAPRVDLASGGVLLVQILNLRHDATAQLVVSAIAVPLLLVARLRRNPWCWFALATGIASRLSGDFVLLENHEVAPTYAVALVGAGLLARDQDWVLGRSAALVIGSIFALATFWKLTSGQFADGRFFRFTILSDDRFEHIWWLTGQDAVAAAGSMERASSAMAAAPGAEAQLVEGPRSVAVATLLTWWTIVFEAAVAVLFLWPARRLETLRHVILLGFIITTYVVVPVAGFGTLLAALGAIAAGDPAWRVRYAAVFAVLLVWTPVWQALFG